MPERSPESGGEDPRHQGRAGADTPNLREAAASIASGIVYNAGQTCHAGSRLIVDRAIKDEVLQEVSKIAEVIHLEDPLDTAAKMGAGPVILNTPRMPSARQVEEILVEAAGVSARGTGVQNAPRGAPRGPDEPADCFRRTPRSA